MANVAEYNIPPVEHSTNGEPQAWKLEPGRVPGKFKMKLIGWYTKNRLSNKRANLYDRPCINYMVLFPVENSSWGV